MRINWTRDWPFTVVGAGFNYAGAAGIVFGLGYGVPSLVEMGVMLVALGFLTIVAPAFWRLFRKMWGA